MAWPLRFTRIAVPKPWAGTRLARLFPALRNELPPGTGESIEIADLPGRSSVVAHGPWRERTLHELALSEPAALGLPADGPGDFPLALKLIDTAEPLSVQVHPQDEPRQGKPAARGKSEAWLVLDAAPRAVIYQGPREGVTAARFEAALEAGAPAELLNARPVRAGDYLYNPAGMIHAIGGGLALLEVQQNCDVTYRLWDFPRPGPPRDTQRERGLAAARWDLPLPSVLRTDGAEVVLQGEGPFRVRSLRLSNARLLRGQWQGFVLISCLGGACELTARVADRVEPVVLQPPDTVLIPGEFDALELYPQGEAWLVLTWAPAP
jgi:mannose-6-phosphate isomerase